jgi:hypothetical protein
MEKFISGDYDKIELIYNQFKMPQRKLFKRSNFTIGSSTIRFDSFGWRLYFEPSKEDYHDIDSKIVEDTIVQKRSEIHSLLNMVLV